MSLAYTNNKKQITTYMGSKYMPNTVYNKPKIINMEPKKKINWARIWQIIQAIITMILATETATRSL